MGQYYAKFLDKLQEKICEKRSTSFIRTMLTCTRVIAMAKIHELRYEFLPNPTYLTDLAPSDIYLFPKLKIFLGGWRFPTTEELRAEMEGYFAGLEESHFRDWIKAF
jgi:hypothetical protein